MNLYQAMTASPQPVLSPQRPSALNPMEKKEISDSRALQEIINILKNTTHSDFKNREAYVREVLKEHK